MTKFLKQLNKLCSMATKLNLIDSRIEFEVNNMKWVIVVEASDKNKKKGEE